MGERARREEGGGLEGDWRVPTLEEALAPPPGPWSTLRAGFQERRDWQRWGWSKGLGSQTGRPGPTLVGGSRWPRQPAARSAGHLPVVAAQREGALRRGGRAALEVVDATFVDDHKAQGPCGRGGAGEPQSWAGPTLGTMPGGPGWLQARVYTGSRSMGMQVPPGAGGDSGDCVAPRNKD